MFIFQSNFTFAANLAGEFANFANSNTHLLAKRHLTSRYNEHLYQIGSRHPRSAKVSTATFAGLLTSPHPDVRTEQDQNFYLNRVDRSMFMGNFNPNC